MATRWVLSYGDTPPSAVEARAASVWMDLTSPTGELVARRQFPHDGSDCGAIASAMSAVVERSLHELGWTRGEPLPERVASQPRAAPAATAAPARPRPPRLIVGMGPVAGTSARVGVNLLAEVRLRLAGPVSLRLGGGLLTKDESEAVGNGRARVSSRQLAAAVLSSFFRGRAHVDAGAVLVVAIERGSTERLAQNSEGRRAALAAGVVLGVGAKLSPRWRLALEVQGTRAVTGGDFVVALDGGRRTVLPPPTWQGAVCAKLEFVAWP